MQVSEKAIALFGDTYSEKLFRQQLVFFEDIDYSEPIEWIATPIAEEHIKKNSYNLLLIFSLSAFLLLSNLTDYLSLSHV